MFSVAHTSTSNRNPLENPRRTSSRTLLEPCITNCSTPLAYTKKGQRLIEQLERVDGRPPIPNVCKEDLSQHVGFDLWALLGGSWVVISGVTSKVSIIMTHIRGLVTTHEPPSRC